MSRLRNVLLLLWLSVMAAGCATLPRYYPVTIISDPPGARIEINNNYFGVTPLTINFNTQYDWFNGEVGDFTVTAYPSVPGQYLQQKRIIPPIPQTIYFNMNLETTTATIKSDQTITIRQ